MRTIISLVAASVMGTGVAYAEPVAPADVEFQEGAVSASLSGVAGDPAEGRAIVGSKKKGNCIACHMVAELEAEAPFHGEIGPPLDGVADRWSEAEIRGIVANAKVMFEDSMMPSFYKTTGFIRPGNAFTGKAAEGELPPLLTAQQIEDVVAYLLTMKE